MSRLTGAHVVLFSEEAEAARGFLRDVLGLDGVDAGGGWLIFGLPPAELAVHPADRGGRHALYLMCDDLAAAMSELEGRGVEFTGPAADEGWGRIAFMRVPGAGELGLYEPRHARPDA
jgi:catechol 2,3-dioxygenase-like lactoylglutathione lyase family enzyme